MVRAELVEPTISPVLELRGAGQRFAETGWVLEDISLAIAPGECVALLGPSGAGKSTLLSWFNGARRPTVGDVWVLGEPLNQVRSPRRRRLQQQVGTIYQQFHLINNLSVLHNVNAGNLGRWPLWKTVWSLLWPLNQRQCLELLEQVGIPDKIFDVVGRLSGGQQQRVAIARVLMQNPQAILADEPVASLDPERSRQVLALLTQLCRSHGKTLVASLHTVDLAQQFFDRAIALQDRRILFDKPMAAVTEKDLRYLYRSPSGADTKLEIDKLG